MFPTHSLRTIAVPLLAGFALAAQATGAEDWPGMRPGLWQTSMEFAPGQAASSSRCLSADEARNVRFGEMSSVSAAQGCQPARFEKESASVFLARYSCKDGDYLVRVSRPDAEHAKIETTAPGKGKSRTMVMNMKYVGPCKG